MSTVNIEDVCNNIGISLARIVGESNDLGKLRQRTGFLDSLVSQENTSAHPEQIPVDSGDGKIKQVNVRYLPADNGDAVFTEAADICEPVATDDYLFKPVTPTKLIGTQVTFTHEQMRKWCVSPAEGRAEIILTKLNKMFVGMNNELIALANAAAGNFYNGVAPGKQVPLFYQNGGMPQVNPAGEVILLEDMMDLGISARPIVVGAGNLSKYARYQGIGCCNDYGQDVSQVGEFSLYRDQFLGGVTGDANDFLAYAPGALQLVQWNANRGEFAQVDGASAMTTMIDPFTGIEMDLDIIWDKCQKLWVFTFSKTYDLFTIPDDIYGDGEGEGEADDRQGVNNLFKYRAVCGAGDFCGEGEGEGEGEG